MNLREIWTEFRQLKWYEVLGAIAFTLFGMIQV